MSWKDLVPFRKKNIQIRKENVHPFDRLRDEMDALFDDFSRGFSLDTFPGHRGMSFSPSIDIKEGEKELKVTAELPGMDDKDIEVNLNRDTLTIRGEKKEEKEDKGKDYFHVERSYGSFSRTIPLPFEIESDKVEASFKKGVLSVTVPKSAKAIEAKKKIPVTVE